MRYLVFLLIVCSAFKASAENRDSIPDLPYLNTFKGHPVKSTSQFVSDSGIVMYKNDDTTAKPRSTYSAIKFLAGKPYYWDGIKWNPIANGLKVVENLSDLYTITANDSGELVFVSDTLQGGLFSFKTAPLYNIVDSIISIPCVNGFFVRDLTQTTGILARWYPNVQGDSVTDCTPGLQKAMDYLALLHGGILTIDRPGCYSVGGLKIKEGVTFAGFTALKSGVLLPPNPVRLRRKTTDTCIIDARNALGWTIQDLAFDGNGANTYASNEDSSDDNKKFGSGVLGNFGTSGALIQRCHFYGLNIEIYGGGNGGRFTIIQNQFTDCRTAIASVLDSHIQLNLFHRCRNAISINNGQDVIESNFIEFSGTDSEPGSAIFIGGNATRIDILNNTTDRNRGYDINIQRNPKKRPFLINIKGNTFKRAAWGDSASYINRISVRIDSADFVSVSNNTFFASDYDASNLEGYLSPVYALSISGCTNITAYGNDVNSIKNEIDFGDSTNQNYTWTQSLSHTNEYYLGVSSESHRAWIFMPDNVGYRLGYMDSASSGTLAAGEWAWGDKDALGYSTLYVRLTDGINPSLIDTNGILLAYYNTAPIRLNGNQTISTNSWRDYIGGFTSDSVNLVLNTQSQTDINSISNYVLRVESRERDTDTARYAMADIPIIIRRRANNTYPQIVIGQKIEWQSIGGGMVSDSTVTNGIQVMNIKSDGIGKHIYFTLKYTSINEGASDEYKAYLLW